ncbi:MAG: hypothetical protein U0031_02480 [Thermomicrobiales bacterium]
MAEVRDVRVGVSYFGNRYPEHARRDMRAIAASGARFVVHAVSENDLRWNPGTIGELVAIGREEGLQPWFVPWALGGVFGGESASYAVGEHPEACQRAGDGRHLPALCPRQPVFRTLMVAWLDAAAAAGAEVVQWDELHLALPHQPGGSDWACRCGACQAAYEARFGEEMPGEATSEVAALARDLLATTLTWLVEESRARGLESSIVQLADASYDPAFWRTAASLPGVRYFGCTPFWYFYDIPVAEVDGFVSLWSERMVAATAGSNAHPLGWVQAFQVPAGREAEIARAVETMVRSGIDTIAVWSFLACAAMSGLAADDVGATWSAVTSSIRRVAIDRD